jgi:hypothetical protein
MIAHKRERVVCACDEGEKAECLTSTCYPLSMIADLFNLIKKVVCKVYIAHSHCLSQLLKPVSC